MPSGRVRPLMFRLQCERGGYPYYAVRVFDTVEAMRAFCMKHGSPRNYAKVEASVHAHTRIRATGRRWKRLPGIGWIAFHRGNLGAGIVSHEMTHAALYYLELRRPQLFRRLQTSRVADETLAWVQGRLVSAFWRAYYRRVPHDEPRPREGGHAGRAGRA